MSSSVGGMKTQHVVVLFLLLALTRVRSAAKIMPTTLIGGVGRNAPLKHAFMPRHDSCIGMLFAPLYCNCLTRSAAKNHVKITVYKQKTPYKLETWGKMPWHDSCIWGKAPLMPRHDSCMWHAFMPWHDSCMCG